MIRKHGTVVFRIAFTAAILASAVFFHGCGQQTTKPEDNNNAIIVTVDGLSFYNTIFGRLIEKRNDYLQSNLSKIMKKENIKAFHWSGDVKDTAAALKASGSGSLREFLRKNYQEAREKGKAFIIVSHSWGTILSYVSLAMEPQIVCDLFITLSCPLGTASGLARSAERTVRDYTDTNLIMMAFKVRGASFPHARVFYNFWAKGDLISGAISKKVPAALNVQDVRVDEGLPAFRDIRDCLFWHEFTTLGDEVLIGATYLPFYRLIVSYSKNDVVLARNRLINHIVLLINGTGY